MASITLNADGTVSDVNFDGETVSYEQGKGVTTSPSTIGDPNAPVPYSDEQLEEALQHTQGIGSPEQAELDHMQQRATFCETKANEVASCQADGTPVYARSETERAQLLRQAKGIRDGLPLQLIMSNRAIATRYLDEQARIANAQQELANHAALEQRAREIEFEEQAKELAALMSKRKVSGERR
jgi:hypothetical protein